MLVFSVNCLDNAEDLAADSRTLLANGAVSGKTTVAFDGGTVKPGALVGRQVLIGNACVTVRENTASSMTVDAPVTVEDNAILYPGEAGAQGRDVYVTLVLGADGYGTTETFWNSFLRPEDLPAMAGSAGRSCTDDEVRIVRLTDAGSASPEDTVPADGKTPGEIILQASCKSALCYTQNPALTAERYHDGWFYTHDVGTWDAQHFITVSGRRDDMIVCKG